MKKPFKASNASLIAINAMLGYAAILMITGLWLWPDQLIDYGWGILSILMIASSLGLTINGVKKIFAREDFIRQQQELLNEGNEVKSSGLASAGLPIKQGAKVK